MGEKEDLIKEAETLIEESFSKVPEGGIINSTNTDELEDIKYQRNRLVIEDILKKGEKSERKSK
jgi:hypothetical protein